MIESYQLFDSEALQKARWDVTYLPAIEPTAVFTPFGNRVEIRCFGKTRDWSLGKLRTKTDLENRESQCLYEDILRVADSAGVSRLLAPRPSAFNAVICRPEELTEEIEITDDCWLLGKLTLCRGVDADGCEVLVGQGFWISPADCPVIVAYSPATSRVIAAHGGRDSLFDRKRLQTVGKERSRPNHSVAESILLQFPEEERMQLKFFITCGIGPEHFDHPWNHPQWGEENKQLIESLMMLWGRSFIVGKEMEGCLALTELIRQQLTGLPHCLRPHNVGNDTIDTYGDLGPDGQPLWWSHRRGDGAKRNGVMVVRRW